MNSEPLEHGAGVRQRARRARGLGPMSLPGAVPDPGKEVIGALHLLCRPCRTVRARWSAALADSMELQQSSYQAPGVSRGSSRQLRGARRLDWVAGETRQLGNQLIDIHGLQQTGLATGIQCALAVFGIFMTGNSNHVRAAGPVVVSPSAVTVAMLSPQLVVESSTASGASRCAWATAPWPPSHSAMSYPGAVGGCRAGQAAVVVGGSAMSTSGGARRETGAAAASSFAWASKTCGASEPQRYGEDDRLLRENARSSYESRRLVAELLRECRMQDAGCRERRVFHILPHSSDAGWLPASRPAATRGASRTGRCRCVRGGRASASRWPCAPRRS